MSQGREYLTEYERLVVSLAEVERKRGVFWEPLRLIYRRIAEEEFGDGRILSLGIGTGQVEEMAGLDPRRIVGVDVSPDYLRKASKRLPGATFYQGWERCPLFIL